MGGDVIVDAALHLPGRVAGLVWADTYDTVGEPRTPEEIAQFLVPFREDFVAATRGSVRGMFVPNSDADLVEWVAGDMSAAPPEIALDALEHAISNDAAILAGLQALQRHGVRTVRMSGVGHFLMMEDPDRFNRLLGETIAGFRG